MRILPASLLFDNYPDLLDIKLGYKSNLDTESQAFLANLLLRINPMGRHYVYLKGGHEYFMSKEGLGEMADYLNLRYKLFSGKDGLAQMLNIGGIIKQVDLLALYAKRQTEELISHHGDETEWKDRTVMGGGLNFHLPGQHTAMFGITNQDNGEGLSKMVNFGRYRPVWGQQPSLPLYYFGSYKWDDITDFMIGGISFGGGEDGDDGKRSNQLVLPAGTGMMSGLYFNTGGLSDLRDLRRLEELTSKYGTRTQEIGAVSLIFAYMDIDISDPNNPQWGTGHQGFGDVELYIVPTANLLGLKDPFIFGTYEWANNVGFNPFSGFSTETEDWYSIGGGAKLPFGLNFTVVAIPKKDEWRAELFTKIGF